MMKRMFAMVLVGLLTFVLMSVSAMADEICVYLGGVGMAVGDYLHVGAGAVSSAAPTDGTGYAHLTAEIGEDEQYHYTLTLQDYTYEGEGYEYYWNGSAVLSALCDLRVKMEGVNKLKNTQSHGYGIYSEWESYVFCGDGSLTIDAGYQPIGGYPFDECTLTLESGTLTCNAERSNSVFCAIDFGGDINITGGTLNAHDNYRYEDPDGEVSEGYYALRTRSDINISGGSVNLTSGKDGNGIYTSEGKVNISGGNVKMDVYRYGVLAHNDISITGGTVEITAQVPLMTDWECELTCTLPRADDIVIIRHDDWSEHVLGRESCLNAYYDGDPVVHTIRLPSKTIPAPVPAQPASVPSTGDGTPVALWLALMAVSAVCMLTLRRRQA